MNDVSIMTWDSTFFGQKIGSLHLTVTEPGHLASKLARARSNGYILVCIFANGPVLFDDNLLKQYAGQLVDKKLTYVQSMSSDIADVTDPAIRLVDPNEDRTTLYELAYQSGECSRFRVDRRFGDDAFKRFYRQWLDNSLIGEMADAIYVYTLPTSIGGFITVKKKLGLATIGLLATDKAVRGQGIGRALVNKVRQYVAASQLATLEVVTQYANHTACQFYEHNGFALKETAWVYHCWL